MPIDRLCPTVSLQQQCLQPQLSVPPYSLLLGNTIPLFKAVGRMVHVPCAVAFCNLFRLNYLHWIEDLLAERRMETAGTWRHPWIPPGVPSKVEYHGSTLHLDLPNHVRGAFGIDIGTGASAIYPLLGAAMNDWHFLATEIDPVSISSAANNIKRNGLQDRIQICEVQSGQFIEPALANASFGRKGFEKEADSVQHVQCDFLMCNPPYFSTMQEVRYEERNLKTMVFYATGFPVVARLEATPAPLAWVNPGRWQLPNMRKEEKKLSSQPCLKILNGLNTQCAGLHH